MQKICTLASRTLASLMQKVFHAQSMSIGLEPRASTPYSLMFGWLLLGATYTCALYMLSSVSPASF